MKLRKQGSTSYPITFLMVDSVDHIAGKTGLTPTVTISKDGGAFGSPAGAVSEIGNGWYALSGNATDRATLGELLLHAEAAGADPIDGLYVIVPYDPFVAIGADVLQISGDATAADNLETMLDGAGGATLTLKKLVINNPDALGVGIQVNAYNAAHLEGTNKGVTLQGGSNQALYMLSDTAATTVYIEGPATGGKGISISSPSDGTSLPGASGIYIQTERGHPGILFDFTDPADAIKIVNSDNGNWVLDDKLFATASDAADAVRTELAVELAHLDADVSSAGGGLTAQETRDAMKLAPTAGTPAAGSVDAHLDTIVSDVAAVKAITDTLDRSALTVVTVNDVGAITIISTTNLAGTVTGLTIPAGWLRMYWTIKRSLLDADADAILQIVVTNGGDADDGVLVINGAAPDDATVGSLVVNQPAGSVAFALTAGATALLQEAGSLVWDLKYHLDDLDEAKTQCAVGTASITLAVTLT